MASGARGGAEFTGEVTGNVAAHSDDELASSRLRDAELPRFLDLRLHAVAERAGFRLDQCEELALRRALDAQHILHHKNSRAEGGNVFEEDPEKVASLVFANAGAVIRRVHLPHRAVTLTRRPTHNDIHLVDTELGRQLVRREIGEVFAQGERVLRGVGLERGDCLLVEVNRSQHAEACSLHSQTETAAAAKQVEAGEGVVGWIGCYFSHEILISFSSGLNSGSPVTRSAFFSFASAAAKASARLNEMRALKSAAMSASARVTG